MAITGHMRRGHRASGWAWSAAGAMPSSARSTASPRGSTTSMNWSRAAFRRIPNKSPASGADLGVDPRRVYASFAEMAAREARRKDGIEAVAIVTPNHMHAPVAMQFLKRGIHVICDKPLTATLAEAKKLAKAAEASGVVFRADPQLHRLSDDPAGARRWCAAGDLGEIRLVQVEYAQDWLTEPHRSRPARSRPTGAPTRRRPGAGGSTGDIGTHAFNLASFVTGLELDSLAADLQTFVPGRRVDDNGHVLLRYKGGARGMLWCQPGRVGQRKRACACGSTAPRPGSNGRRRTRTICGSRPFGAAEAIG